MSPSKLSIRAKIRALSGVTDVFALPTTKTDICSEESYSTTSLSSSSSSPPVVKVSSSGDSASSDCKIVLSSKSSTTSSATDICFITIGFFTSSSFFTTQNKASVKHPRVKARFKIFPFIYLSSAFNLSKE